MKTARTIGMGFGLIVLVGVGAATFSRAQQPGDKALTQTPTRADLRERIITMRAEADLLQVEYDGARAQLLKAIEMSGTLEFTTFDTFIAGAMSLRGKNDQETTEIIENIRSNFKGVDSAKLSKAVADFARGEKGAAKEIHATLKGLQNPYAVLVGINKAEFARLSSELNRKKLDLAEAEKQYQNEAR